MKMTGAKMVIECLIKEKTEVVFGYPGGAIMNVYDEIYKQSTFQHILNRHEQGSIHSAQGYSKATGKVGVAIVTSGPGFTNSVTGLADAYCDSVPIVVISGQVPTSIIGTDGFQEIDAVGISRPCTKHNFLIQDVKDIPRIMKEAFHIASTGRKGPVHIDIPKDITIHEADFKYPSKVDIPTYKPVTKGNQKQIKKALEAIADSKKPILYIGGGAINSDCAYDIREFVQKTKIPLVETLMARGTLDVDDPYLFGMLGMHGEYAANMAMSKADIIICLGARFDDRVTGRLDSFGKNAKIVHVDIDPASIDKIVSTNYPIVGDLKLVVKDLLLLSKDYNFNDYTSWVNSIKELRVKEPLRFEDSSNDIKPQWVIKRTGEILKDKAMISTDVGQHQMWAAQFYPFSYPRQFITSGGLGTMGYGLPAALGIARANLDKVAINFTGDGSILMNIQELLTCSCYKLPVINIILNNNYLGMVRQWQSLFYDNRLSETDLSRQPDFVKLVESFGGNGYRVTTKKEFDDALNDAVKSKKVCMIDVVVSRQEDVLPMVPNGHALDEMKLFGDEDE